MRLKETAGNREIYIWNIFGSICNALASVILLMLVNRILGVKNGDVFSLAFSIAQLMQTIGTFQVRVYQATDVTNRFCFHDYFEFRILTCAAMLVSSFVYIAAQGFTGWKALIIILLCMYRVIDSFSDVYQGMFQQNERLDLAGKSVAVKIVIPTVFFGVCMLLTGSLAWACAVFVLSELVLFFVFDVHVCRWFVGLHPEIAERSGRSFIQNAARLSLLCGPLFVNGFLITAVYNEPKLAIDRYIASGALADGIQTYYSILFMPAFAINMLLIVLRPLITSMAISWSRGEHKRVYSTLRKICLFLTAGTAAAAIAAWLIGIPVLSWIYGTGAALYEYRNELLLLIIAGGINALSNILDNVITIFRYQHSLLIAYGAAYLTAIAAAGPLVSRYGLTGAAYTYLLSMIVLLTVILCIFAISLFLARKRAKGKPDITKYNI